MRTAIRASVVAAAVAGVTLAGVPAAAAGYTRSYRTVVLGTLGGSSSVPTGLNDRGAIVGWATPRAAAYTLFCGGTGG